MEFERVMGTKSTLIPALYFAGAMTMGTLGVSDAVETIDNIGTYTFMKQGAKSTAFDTKKEAQYQASMSRDDIYWYGTKTALEFILTGVFATMGLRRIKRED